jgi:hypothetical protein
LLPGPTGDYLEVIDVDPASGCAYEPVDLNDPHLLATNGLPPSEDNPKFHQQMVYAVAMTTIQHFERALGRQVLWSEGRVEPPTMASPDISRCSACGSISTHCATRTPTTIQSRRHSSLGTSRLAPVPAEPHPSFSRLGRHDLTGLVWLLQGRRVTALTADTASIWHPTGSITVFRKNNRPAYGLMGDTRV